MIREGKERRPMTAVEWLFTREHQENSLSAWKPRGGPMVVLPSDEQINEIVGENEGLSGDAEHDHAAGHAAGVGEGIDGSTNLGLGMEFAVEAVDGSDNEPESGGAGRGTGLCSVEPDVTVEKPTAELEYQTETDDRINERQDLTPS